MSDDELNEMLERFARRIYTDTLDGRDALTSGPPYYSKEWTMKIINEEFPIIKKRLNDLANFYNSDIVNGFVLHYRVEEEGNQAAESAGAGRHPDKFPHPKITWGRALDTVGNALSGEKTMTFYEVATDKSVTITVPHGTTLVMTSVCAGNEKSLYEHSVAGAGGTMFFGIDMAKKGLAPSKILAA